MVDVRNVQAVVVRPSLRPLFAILLFRITSASGAKEFLRTWTQAVPAGDDPETPGAAVFHPMVSWRAIELLLGETGGFDLAAGRAAFEPFFVDRRQAPESPALAEQLGFFGQSGPAGWWDRFGSADIDLALYSTFESEAQRTEALAAVRGSASALGLVELPIAEFPEGTLAGCRPEGGRLHFGYRDGITAPDVDWADEPSPGRVNFREFVLGHPTADYPTSPWKAGPWQDFASEGSFACLTWIHQDVAAFNRFLRQNAAAVAPLAAGTDPEAWLASRVMGRWPDGSPTVVHPERPPEAPDLDDRFGYAGDANGDRCPLTAHVRVVYGRDEPLSFANQIRFPKGAPRLIRRGFSYGPHLDGEVDDGHGRGVVGLFFCARVNEQFYTVLRWMQKTDFADGFASLPKGAERQDALTGQRPHPAAVASLRLDAPEESIEIDLANFIRYRGVAVLFAPGVRSLNVLAGA